MGKWQVVRVKFEYFLKGLSGGTALLICAYCLDQQIGRKCQKTDDLKGYQRKMGPFGLPLPAQFFWGRRGVNILRRRRMQLKEIKQIDNRRIEIILDKNVPIGQKCYFIGGDIFHDPERRVIVFGVKPEIFDTAILLWCHLTKISF